MKALKFSAILLISLFSYNCSTAGTDIQKNNDGDKKKTLIFDRTEDGKDVNYRAEFKDDKIISIERNGQKLTDEEKEKYSDAVYEELGDLTIQRHFNFREFDKGKHKVFKFRHSPDSTFTVQMDKMKDDLKKIRKIEIKVDGLDDLKELENLRDIDIPKIDVKVNMDMNQFKEDLEQLKKDMQQLKEELKSYKKK